MVRRVISLVQLCLCVCGEESDMTWTAVYMVITVI